MEIKGQYSSIESWTIFFSYLYQGTGGKHTQDSMEAIELLKEKGFHVLQFEESLEMEKKGKPC